jgi:hypothetical protein
MQIIFFQFLTYNKLRSTLARGSLLFLIEFLSHYYNLLNKGHNKKSTFKSTAF